MVPQEVGGDSDTCGTKWVASKDEVSGLSEDRALHTQENAVETDRKGKTWNQTGRLLA